MTTFARLWSSQQDLSLGFAHGDVIRKETYMKLQWAWIAFPASLLVLAIAFLALTVWHTRKSRRPTRQTGAWKSSSLAVLFGGLDEEERRNCGVIEEKSEIDSCANRLKVSLRPGNDGWSLGQ
jgi:hypothetical protein